MRVGVLVSSIGNFGTSGFYNAQEIGLAKALASLCSEVKVYKLFAGDGTCREESIGSCDNASITFVPAKHAGINGFVDTSVLDKSLDALIYFSDTQLSLPRVARWAGRNGITLLPYIGVLGSHSTNRVKKWLMDRLLFRNLRVYRKCHCFAKTPTVAGLLKDFGVADVTVAPVGLDFSLLKGDYQNHQAGALKQKYGYGPDEKVLLFIGRLTEEKRPVEMVELFSKLVEKDSAFRLLMVGSGELSADVDHAISKYGLQNAVRRIERIANSEIWELYRMAEVFVNLNRQEIFGMAILEAMYYGCKVVAWHAPGPDYMIENGVSGWLVESAEQAVEKIMDMSNLSAAANQRIKTAFLWENTAYKMTEYLRKRASKP